MNSEITVDAHLPLLTLSPVVKGIRYHTGYVAPLAVQRFSGLVRLQPAIGIPGLLFVLSGTLREGKSGTTKSGPFLAPVEGLWTSLTPSEGWFLAFHPVVINQEFSSWPNLLQKPAPDPFLERDLQLLKSVLAGTTHTGPSEGWLLLEEEAAFLKRLFATLADLLESQSDIYWPCRSRSLFLEVLFFLWQRPEPVSLGPGRSRSQLIHDWLRIHYAEKITISQLVGQFGTNRTTLQEQFRQTYGTSVMDFLGEIRCQVGSVLMRNTELTLAEIGTRVGFEEYSGFYREFRRRLGVSPHDYRKTVAHVQIY